MIKYRTDHGKELVEMMKDGRIPKETFKNDELEFHGGYEQLRLEQFITYLGGVSRCLQNRRLKNLPYTGE